MVDLDELARRAVAAPPVQPSSLERLEHRVRRRRRRRRLAGALTLLALAAVGLGVPRLAGDGKDGAAVIAGEPDEEQVSAGWTMHQAAGASVAVPPGWAFTDEDLMPATNDPGPRMVWAVGTHPLPGYDGGPCPHQPAAALDRLESDGALVVLYERSNALSYSPEREESLWSMRGDPNFDDAQRCSSGDFDSWFFAFNDQARGFYMLVAVGPEAGPRICDIERLVDSVTVADRSGEPDERGSAASASAAAAAALAPCTDPRNPLWDLPLGHDHLGPVEIGMTVEQAAEALGEAVVPKETGSACALYRPISSPNAIEFRVDAGQIVVIQAGVVLQTEGTTSDAGVAVGDAEGAIHEAYSDETVVDVSHPAGRQVLVRPTANSAHATVFDLEGGTVARMRAGTYPEVEQYLEGCP